jgi:PAS domain S-box-containing protein
MYSVVKSSQSFFKIHRSAISTNAALDLHHHFWDSFENRSLMHGKQCDIQVHPSEDMNAVQKDHKSYEETQDQLMRNAREDLVKHFRMNASLRAMKRGDGILSEHFSLPGTLPRDGFQVPYHIMDGDMTLIDVETERKAREDMHHHFWNAHQDRQIATKQQQKEKEAIIQESKVQRQDMIAQHAVHPDKSRSRVPLPTRLQDIRMEFSSQNSHKHHAIAITEIEPPFKIIDVNTAWIDLCGFSRKAAVGSTLKLLQGPDTNVEAANKLVESLLTEKEMASDSSKECETVLTNYRSDGRKFRNHIRVGLVKDDAGNVVNFVGVFKRLNDDDGMII